MLSSATVAVRITGNAFWLVAWNRVVNQSVNTVPWPPPSYLAAVGLLRGIQKMSINAEDEKVLQLVTAVKRYFCRFFALPACGTP